MHHKDEIGFYIQSLANPKNSFGIQEDRVFESSSTIKVPIILLLLMFLDKNKISINRKYELKPEHYSQGSGILNWKPRPTIRLKKALYFCIFYSDCVATNLFIDVIGGKEVLNKQIKQLGFSKTKLQMDSLQFTNQESTMPKVGSTTPKEMALLFGQIAEYKESYRFLPRYFSKAYQSWHNGKLNAKNLKAECFFYKTGSMTFVGKHNHTITNLTGYIKRNGEEYVFGFFTSSHLGEDADENTYNQKMIQHREHLQKLILDFTE